MVVVKPLVTGGSGRDGDQGLGEDPEVGLNTAIGIAHSSVGRPIEFGTGKVVASSADLTG